MAVFSKVLGGIVSLAYVVSALNNGLAVTPQMGWGKLPSSIEGSIYRVLGFLFAGRLSHMAIPSPDMMIHR